MKDEQGETAAAEALKGDRKKVFNDHPDAFPEYDGSRRRRHRGWGSTNDRGALWARERGLDHGSRLDSLKASRPNRPVHISVGAGEEVAEGERTAPPTASCFDKHLGTPAQPLKYPPVAQDHRY